VEIPEDNVERGGDDELASATASLETAMKRLESATGIVTFAKVVDIDRDTTEIKGNVVTIVGLAQDISTDLARMDGTAQEMAQGVQSLHDKVDKNYLKLSAKFEQMLVAQQHSLAPPVAPASTAKAANKPTSFNVVQRFFNAHDNSNARNQEVEYSFVDGTTEWLFERKQFVNWSKDLSASPYLWIIGKGGVGKSFLAYSALRKLQRQTASHSNMTVAHYYFRQQTLEGRSATNNVFAVMHSMLSAIVNQIAMYDKAFCDQVATTITSIREDIVTPDAVARFEKFLAFKFKETLAEESSNCLFLILDGLDEICESSKEIMMCLQEIITRQWNIRVLLTSRTNFKGVDELAGAEKIHIAKDDVKNDVQVIAASKIKHASRLRKLRPAAKRIVENTLVEQSDCLLYTDQALRRLNKYHQESSVLTALSELPKGLDGLYCKLEEEVAARRTPDELQTVRLAYTWIAFAKQSISVEQITDVVKLRGLFKLFNIEEEISSRSGLVLTVARDLDPAMFDSEDSDDVDQSTLDAISVSELMGTVDTAPIVRFHNRSMKDHLRETSSTEGSICESKSSAAFSMFEVCAQIITSSVEGPVCARLRRYAATNWALHFNDIDPSTMTDEAFDRGLHILYDVLTNKNNVATFVEKNYMLTPNSPPYFYIDNSPYAYMHAQAKQGGELRVTQFKSNVEEWLKKSAGVGSLENQPELSAWVQQLAAQPERTLDMREHICKTGWLDARIN
jgi:DNA replication protein DnaC